MQYSMVTMARGILTQASRKPANPARPCTIRTPSTLSTHRKAALATGIRTPAEVQAACDDVSHSSRAFFIRREQEASTPLMQASCASFSSRHSAVVEKPKPAEKASGSAVAASTAPETLPTVSSPLRFKHPKLPLHDPLDGLLIAMTAIPAPSAAEARTVSMTGLATEVVQTTGGATGTGSRGGLLTNIQEQPVAGAIAQATRTATA